MKRIELSVVFAVGAAACSSPATKPAETVVPVVVAKPAAPETTCLAGQTPGETRRYEHGIRSIHDTEVARWTVDSTSRFPMEALLGDRTFRIVSPVRRCDADGRMHFLGVQVESNGLRTVGFTPPDERYDGYGASANACQINPEAYCQATCTKQSCPDTRCRTLHAVPVLYECSNPIEHELARTTEPPNEEQQKRGIKEVLVTDRLVVREYDADASTGTWKSLVLVRETHREEVDPSKADAARP